MSARKERGQRRRMGVGLQSAEVGGGVASVARLAGRAAMDVFVTRGARGRQTGEPHRDRRPCSRRPRRTGGCRALVAARAGEGGVSPREREPGRRGVVERRLLERLRRVAGAAVLLELSGVDIGVAVAARLRLEVNLCWRLDVAGRTGCGDVGSLQRKRCARMVELPGLPRVGGMAGRAVRSERLAVRLVMAVGAGAELQAPVDLVDVALRAVDRPVAAGQREPGLRVIELPSGVGKRRGRRVARRTGRPERALVRVLMARHARRTRVQERPRLVTPRAVARERRMAAFKREPGFCRMVEALDVEPSEVCSDSAVFGVAPLAVPWDIAVNASSPGNPLCDGLVAGQALCRGQRPARLVALLAVGEPFELRMGLRERSRRDERADLRLRRRRGGRPENGPNDCRDHERGRMPRAMNHAPSPARRGGAGRKSTDEYGNPVTAFANGMPGQRRGCQHST